MPLNFYELYHLLNENTVSQELKSLKKNFPRLSGDIIEAKKEMANDPNIVKNVNGNKINDLANYVISQRLERQHLDQNN